MNLSKELDSQLIEACKKNSTIAQMRLYDKYCQGMCTIANRYVQDQFVAEDMMQDAFIKAFQNIDSFKGEVTFGAWLKRIVINTSLDWLKKKKLDLLPLKEEIYRVANEETDWKTTENHTAELVVKTIDNLKDKYRVVLSLYLLEGYDHQEIATILGITEVASRTHLLRGKEQLKQQLKEQYHVEGY